MKTEDVLSAAKAHMTPNYKPPEMILHRGAGSYAWDLDGKKYLDFTTGIGVNALGHNHPKAIAAIKEQIEILCHAANQFYHPNYVSICEKLCDISFGERVFLCNSGTEAMEAALKIARRHFFTQGESRTEFIGTEGAFHGRTLGALSITHAEKYRSGYGPFIPGVEHVPFNNIEAMAAAVKPSTAAVILEPIQGNSGVIIPSPEYFEAVRKICDDAGCLLILDEIQTGVGRTGEWFAYQHTNMTPDILELRQSIERTLQAHGRIVFLDKINCRVNCHKKCTPATCRSKRKGVKTCRFANNVVILLL